MLVILEILFRRGFSVPNTLIGCEFQPITSTMTVHLPLLLMTSLGQVWQSYIASFSASLPTTQQFDFFSSFLLALYLVIFLQ